LHRRCHPPDETNFGYYNDSQPEPEIDQLLLEAIKFRHGQVLAPSNV